VFYPREPEAKVTKHKLQLMGFAEWESSGR
jgi:hypothetical protein